MTTRRDADTMAGATLQRDRLARLGLEPGASADQITAAHRALVAFLAGAPRPIRGWARREAAEVEAAYAGLVPAGEHGPVRNAAGRPDARYIASDGEDPEDLLDALDGRGPATAARAPRPARGRSGQAIGPVVGPAGNGSLRRIGLGVGALAVAAIAIVAVYKLGEPTIPGISGSPVPGATAGVDTARVATLMQTLSANPRDLATLRELANIYYDGGDYATSRSWLDKILAIDPKDIEALLGAGANAYNLGDLEGAERSWRAVIAIDPKSVDAHYDLGLMYFSKDPPDMTAVAEEWGQVLALAPDSQLADIVRTHLPQPSASAPASGAPAGTTSPSPAPTGPAPTGPASPAPSTAPGPS